MTSFLVFKDKMITIDEVKVPMQNINYLQGTSILRALKLSHSLAMEPHSTQDATKHGPVRPRFWRQPRLC